MGKGFEELGGNGSDNDESTRNDYKEYPHVVPFINIEELHEWSLYRGLIAEFIATTLFLYVTISTIIGYSTQSDSGDACRGIGVLGVAWSFGGAIFVLVYCTADISGGHINPAVTFGLFLARKVSFVRAFLYIVAQCLGAICGAGIVKGFNKVYFNHYHSGVNVVNSGYSKGVGLAAEIIGTFVLLYVIFSATDGDPNARQPYIPVLAPLSIGFAVFIVHIATIPITGTGINPARSLGAAIVYNKKEAWNDHWIFWVGPLIGAAMAVAYHRWIIRNDPTKYLSSLLGKPNV